jgi:hypothetical protein
MVSISLDDLNKNLDAAKSRLKRHDFKNLDQDKKNSGLDVMDNLDKLDILDLDWSRLSRPPGLGPTHLPQMLVRLWSKITFWLT